MRIILISTFLLFFIVIHAQPMFAASAELSEFHADVEVDPLAYAFEGHSLHVGFGWDHVRFDLGAFAMALPQAVHGNEAFDASFSGFGGKVQYFFSGEQSGGFAGAGAGVIRPLIALQDTSFAAQSIKFSVGIQAGWRFTLPARFFVTPWVGVDHTVGTTNLTLGGKTYESSRWSLFPTAHLGYRF